MVTESSPEDFEGSVNLQKFFLVQLLGWDLPAGCPTPILVLAWQ